MKIFNSSEYEALNESTSENQGIVEAFLKVGPIKMADGKFVEPSKFVSVVSSALYMFETKHPWEYQFIKHSRILYLIDSRITKTMCVDEFNDVYINVEFLYSYLKMNVKYIMYILYHEAMHNILNHVERGKMYGKKHDNKLTWSEMNICADYEVNGQMVSDRVCSISDWDILHGYCDKQYDGMTFEMIANMKNRLKLKEDGLTWDPKNGGPESVAKTKAEYDKGRDEMKHAINDLLVKNNNDKNKTLLDIELIKSKIKGPKEILKAIRELIEEKEMHFMIIKNTKLFESAFNDEKYVNGLADGLEEELESLKHEKTESEEEKTNGETRNEPGNYEDLNDFDEETDKLDNNHNKESGKENPMHGDIKAKKILETDISNAPEIVGTIIKRSKIEQNLKDSLVASGYDTDEIESIYSEIFNKMRTAASVQEENNKLRDDIITHKNNSVLADLCTKVKVDSEITDEIWEELVQKFLKRTTIYRGSDTNIDDENDIRWGNKNYLAMDDIIMPYYGKTDSAPQYINIFLDTSGSVNAQLCLYFMSIIKKLCDKLDFSGLRVIPFSDVVVENHIFVCTSEKLKEQEAQRKLDDYIYDCAYNCYGGGGNSFSFGSIAKYINKMDIYEPDSVYLVMTDGGLLDPVNIMKYKMFSERVLFCIADYNIEDALKSKQSGLSWCVNPKYNFLKKAYIELKDIKL